MEAVRVEIEGLWSELMMSEYEKDQFVGFIDGQLVSFGHRVAAMS